MKLSDLKTGQSGIIVKVMGHGGFRKRIIEMGFVKGKMVEVLQNAPLQDPVKYRVMGYEVSLRHTEAELIEVVGEDEVAELPDMHISQSEEHSGGVSDCHGTCGDRLMELATRREKIINVALVGNPNCGKTSLFNFASGAHERVGNYSGVTVDAKEGTAHFGEYEIRLVDLPGTYSLSAYSPEELYVRRQIIDKTPDVVVNVIDTSNLERNLYLTTQLIDMNLKMVCALNMYDEAERRGDSIDVNRLSELFGAPMVPTAFNVGRGVDELWGKVIDVYEERADRHVRHLHINHGPYIEEGITAMQAELKANSSLRHRYSTRFLAIKLLENDRDAEHVAQTLPNSGAIMAARDKAEAKLKEYTGEDSETMIMDAKYGFIHGALQEIEYRVGNKKDTYQATHIIDGILTNRFAGLPLFVLIMWLMFEATFSLGQYPMDWIEAGVGVLGDWVSATMADGMFKDMLVQGVIQGVGSVIVFLPQILILYFFISYMEDSGYMARAAFITDKLMHKMGLHGKSFIPLIMAFGCNVPAIMATRTIESRRSRLVTMLILPLFSCSARLPIYVMIIGTMFMPKYHSWIMLSLYLGGILLAALLSRVFTKWVFPGDDTPFVMELPPYRFPTWKAIGRHTWEKGKMYLKKMGGIILVASIIVWALGYFPHRPELGRQEQQEQSYIGRMGKAIEPIFAPQGFNWKLDVGLISGVGAKEIVGSTIGILFADDDSIIDEADDDSAHDRYTVLRHSMEADGVTPLAAYCFLLFVLIYFPCIATIAAIKGETGSWRWALFAAFYTTALAWIVSAAVYQIGSLL